MLRVDLAGQFTATSTRQAPTILYITTVHEKDGPDAAANPYRWQTVPDYVPTTQAGGDGVVLRRAATPRNLADARDPKRAGL
jgi:hypothetical protein